jgi:hypothetical protein
MAAGAAAAAAAAAAASAAAAAAAARRKAEQALEIAECDEIYAGLAAANRLRAGLTDQRTPMLEGDYQGVACSVAIALDGAGWAHTCASAMPLERHGLRLAVVPSPRGALGFLKRLFAHDVKVGDEAFDEAFLVDATPATRAAELLSAPVRAALTAMVGHGLTSFTVDPGGVLLQWSGVERSADVILAAIDLVTTAARFRDAEGPAYR